MSAEWTTVIDLAEYQSEITALTPEPSSLFLGGLGAGIALLAGLRARRQRLVRRSQPQANL